jgi:hypothetical protein
MTVSFASQANQLSISFMAAEVSTWHGKSLSSLARAMQDPVESLRNNTGYTLFRRLVRNKLFFFLHDKSSRTQKLRNRLRGIGGYLPNGVLLDRDHHRGRNSLLLLRNSDKFKSPVGRRLFGITHEIVVSCSENFATFNSNYSCDHAD